MNKEQYKTYLRQRLYEEHSDKLNLYHDKYDSNHVSTPAQLALQQKSDAAAWARLDVVNNGFDVDPRNSKKIDDHPHGALTRAISRHTGMHPLEVFEFTRDLTADSPQKDIDREIHHFVGLQLGRPTTGNEPYMADGQIQNKVAPIFSDLSKQPGSPYFAAASRGDSYSAFKEPRERFIRDFSKHISDNVSTGVHTEFTGTP